MEKNVIEIKELKREMESYQVAYKHVESRNRIEDMELLDKLIEVNRSQQIKLLLKGRYK